MASVPLVTCVVPTYQSAATLADAVTSVLDQEGPSLEVIVVDDGSTDDTTAVLETIADDRLRVIRHSHNQGLVAALNAGIAAARGRFLARMDADDVSLPGRLARQVRHLDLHPEVDLVGANHRPLDDGRVGVASDHPRSPAAVRWGLLFDCVITHPTVVVRREVFDAHGAYEPGAHAYEDYELWLRWREHVRMANLPDVVLHLRRHAGSQSSVHAARVAGQVAALLTDAHARVASPPPSPALLAAARATHRVRTDPGIAPGVVEHLCRLWTAEAPRLDGDGEALAAFEHRVAHVIRNAVRSPAATRQALRTVGWSPLRFARVLVTRWRARA